MKRNPVYKRLLRIEITLILFLICCLLVVKSCFRPHNVRQQTQQGSMLTEPIFLPDDPPPPISHDREDSRAPAIQPEPVSLEASSPREEVGVASYYQDAFHGHSTASGERYDLTQYTAAHRELPFGTEVRVTNIENGRQVTVRINDRGPNKQERIIDLSGQAAKAIGLAEAGITQVKLEVLK